MLTLRRGPPREDDQIEAEMQSARAAAKLSLSRLCGRVAASRPVALVRRHSVLTAACLGAVCGAGICGLLMRRGRTAVQAPPARAHRFRRVLIAPIRGMFLSWLSGLLAAPAIHSATTQSDFDVPAPASDA